MLSVASLTHTQIRTDGVKKIYSYRSGVLPYPKKPLHALERSLSRTIRNCYSKERNRIWKNLT